MSPSELVKQANIILADIEREYPRREFYSWPNKWARLMQTVIANEGNIADILIWPIFVECLHSGYVPISREERNLIPIEYRHLAKDPIEFRQPPGFHLSPDGASGTYTKNLFVLEMLRQHADIHWDSDFPVIEIGGGYGSVAILLSRYGFEGKHYVIDHPAMHLMRNGYHAALGIANRTISVEPDALRFGILPDRNATLIAVHSIDEMSFDERTKYLNRINPGTYAIYFTQQWGDMNNNAFFDSYISDNELQVLYDYRGHKNIQRFLIFNHPTQSL